MLAQSGLFGGYEVSAKLPKKKRSAKNVISNECCEACYMAQEEVCVCRCNGKWHGAGNPSWNRSQKRLEGAPISAGAREAAELQGY